MNQRLDNTSLQQSGYAPINNLARSWVPSLPLDKPLIVVIDDSPTIRAILRSCLRRASFQVQTFSDGTEALRWFRSPEGAFPVLVFLDIELPHLNGYDVLRLFKTLPEYAQTVTILLSCRDGLMDRLRGRMGGAFAYMTKPFRTQDILAITQKALAHKNDN